MRKIFFILFLLLNLCIQANDKIASFLPANNYKPGIVLSFDDDYIDEWYDTHNLLKKYDWKATFFVSKAQFLNRNQLNKLLKMQKYGHEIGGHGYMHESAEQYVKNYGLSDYLEKEIYAMNFTMQLNSFQITSFAYPHGSGAHNRTINNALLKNFKILRGTTYGALLPEDQFCYYDGNAVVFGLGLDNNYAQFNERYFLELIDYAKKNSKIVIFYAHKPVKKVTQKYQVDLKTLENICAYAKEKKMKFYKMSELANLNTNK